jgi:hypothetical protein
MRRCRLFDEIHLYELWHFGHALMILLVLSRHFHHWHSVNDWLHSVGAG